MIRKVTGIPRKLAVVASIGAVVLLFAAVAGARSTTVNNFGFEDGNFNLWTVTNTGAGDWFVQQSLTTPISLRGWRGAVEHEYGALTDQDNPGSHILSRTITVGKTTRIEMYVYYKNRADVFCSPASLSEVGPCNQQYRIDLIKTSAAIDSVAPADVLQNLFQTKPSSKFTLKPKHLLVKVNGGISGDVVLRFAEVDNQDVFNASVDGIQINNG